MRRPELLLEVSRATLELRDESRRAIALQREAKDLTARSRALSRALHATASPSPAASGPACRPAEAHDEWLLDEALAETFPASDPISPFCSCLRP